LIQKYDKNLGLDLGLEIKRLALVLVLKIMELLVLTTKSYLHHWVIGTPESSSAVLVMINSKSCVHLQLFSR